MKTISILIGNSDNKLTQAYWADYIAEIDNVVTNHANVIHFTGGSAYYSPYQNACFVFEIQEEKIKWLLEKVTRIRKSYSQDSVAVITGTTEFI